MLLQVMNGIFNHSAPLDMLIVRYYYQLLNQLDLVFTVLTTENH